MTLQLVQSIREAEEKAVALIREAALQVRQIRKQAETESSRTIEQSRAETAVQSQEMLEQAEKEAHEQVKPLLEFQQQKVARIREMAGSKVPAAVALIKERIVKLHAQG
ncbi:MAG TPA: hypothetical protein GX693_05830 [Firmicutes bacterium]|nr:hypothetical protein [Bacillota bacterium]